MKFVENVFPDYSILTVNIVIAQKLTTFLNFTYEPNDLSQV